LVISEDIRTNNHIYINGELSTKPVVVDKFVLKNNQITPLFLYLTVSFIPETGEELPKRKVSFH